jgi:hypothetical protein
MSHITIDSRTVTEAKFTAFKQIIYGTPADSDASTPAVEPRLPLPDEVKTLFTV